MSIPIYGDPSERRIVDVAGEPNSEEWHPANGPARRLCRCLEGLRDVAEGLEHLLTPRNRSKRRRRLRAVVIPLHSLCTATVDLLNGIMAERTFRDRLPADCGRDVSKLVVFLKKHVPFERDGKLARLRNKVSAHYDLDMAPAEMRVLNSSVEITEVAEWISITLSVICDAVKLNAFMWSGEGYKEDSFMLMCTEPLMTDFRLEEGQIVGINGCYVSKSPKWEVYAEIRRVWTLSDKMFERASRWQIKEFIPDEPGQHWSKVLRDKRCLEAS